MRRIQELFAIEARINGLPAATRLAVRQQEAVPRLEELYVWRQTPTAANEIAIFF